jgi:hypothetical protein
MDPLRALIQRSFRLPTAPAFHYRVLLFGFSKALQQLFGSPFLQQVHNHSSNEHDKSDDRCYLRST